MELAVPLVALGGLYVASNQANKKEGYKNIEKNTVTPPPINYPTLAPVTKSNPNKYNSSNTVTDRYYNPKVYKEYRNGPDQFGNVSKKEDFKSLTGDTVNKDNFKHNNMAPFFGGKIRGSTQNPNIAETVLDNMAGLGTQQIKKQEQAPLFAPQKDIRYANGAPNMSEFYQSRVMPGTKMSNVKLWDEQKVGPGLDAGFSSEGQLGFNSGMAARDKWVDRNVDQLRIATNPKQTYGLANHEGPAYNQIKAPATQETQGVVEKYLPDTYFVNTPDRWLTTTGLEKGQTSRAIQVDRAVNRATTSSSYFGGDSNASGTKMYTPSEYEKAKRPQLEANAIANPKAIGTGPATESDYGVTGFKNTPNNRSTTNTAYFGVNGFLKAAVAPIMDVLRPSRKENVIGNINPTGNVQQHVSGLPVWNPADRTPTTIRETTEGKLDMTHLNVEGQKDGAYVVSEQQSIEQERDTTNCQYYGDGGTNTGVSLYNAAYNQRNNVNKTYKNRPNQGGMSLLNANENIHIDKNESDRNNNRMWIRNGGTNGTIPSADTFGKINVPQYYDNCMSCDRIQPDILNAFKDNPYTQSLNSY
jgi:hypothetical protein